MALPIACLGRACKSARCVGYADGLSRTLSNRMDVLYQGERIRQVGNICMDQCMVAISETSMGRMPEANYGDV